MGGGLESRCVGRVCGADGAVRQHSTIRTAHTTSTLFQKKGNFNQKGNDYCRFLKLMADNVTRHDVIKYLYGNNSLLRGQLLFS
jgi:hypothetical protein